MLKKGVKLFTLIATVLSVILMSGCASSDRMMRISPLSEDQNDEFSSTERSNVWPIYYHDNGLYSMLWPFVDWDKDGIAIRPLYNREKDDHSILFPLSAWNTTDKDGWVLTGYWGPHSHGIFPTYHHDYKMINYNLNYYTLFWYTKDNQGLFPFFAYGKNYYQFLTAYYDSKDSSYGLWPIYLHDKNETLIPLCYSRTTRGDHEKKDYLLGLLAGSEHRKDWSESYLVPFYYNSENTKNGKSTTNYFPLYYNQKTKDKSSTLFLPFYYKQKIGSEELFVTPLFGYSKDSSGEQSLTNILGPVYIERSHKDYYYKSILWPFYREYKDKNSDQVNLFPLYSNIEKKDYSKTGYLFNTVRFEKAPNGKTCRIWPFSWYSSGYNLDLKHSIADNTIWSYKENKSNGRWKHHLFPFYNNHGSARSITHRYLFGLGKLKRPMKVGDNSVETETRLWPLFSVQNNKEVHSNYLNLGFFAFAKYNKFSDRHHGLSIFSPLILNYSSFWNEGARQASTNYNYLLFGSHYTHFYNANPIPHPLQHGTQKVSQVVMNEFLLWDKEELEFKIWKTDALTAQEMQYIDQWQIDYIKNANRYTSSKLNHSSFKKFPYISLSKLPRKELLIEIKKILDRKKIDYSESITDGLNKLADKCSRSRIERSHSVWPFYTYSAAEEDSELEILWGLINSTQRKDYGRTSFLKYLYRSEREGDSIRRDIIPFITIDSGENSGFSFLGDLCKFRKNKDGRYGSFLFIDWGKHPST